MLVSKPRACAFRCLGGVVATGLALSFTASAPAQFSSNLEDLFGGAFGEVAWGQETGSPLTEMYNPNPDGSTSTPGLVYTYADNDLNIPQNPTEGANDLFIGSIGLGDMGGNSFSRTQLDVPFPKGAARLSWDICPTLQPGSITPAVQNIGSFSINRVDAALPPGGEFRVICLARWTDGAASPLTWDADFVWFNFDGGQLTESVDDEAFQGLQVNHWYRWSILVALDTNRILETTITDLSTGETASNAPDERYLRGGAGGAADLSTSFRLFAGNGAQAGNTIGWDNIVIEEASTAGACCLTDASCLADLESDDCDARGGIFQGFSTSCNSTECFELGPNGWVVTAPFDWRADTCSNPNSCDIDSSPDERWEVGIDQRGLWTFSFCESDFDTQAFLGSDPCGTDLADNDDFAGCLTASVLEDVELEAGTYYLTLEGFNDGCGEFELLASLTGCFPIADNPDALSEDEPVCEDGYVDTTNGGCNNDKQRFTGPVDLGDTYTGSTGANFFDADGVENRDLDWYLLDLTSYPADTDITVTTQSDFTEDLLILLGDTAVTPDDLCPAALAFFAATTNNCQTNEFTFSFGIDDPGLVWIVVTTNFGSADCGSNYEMSVDFGATCTPSNDLDGNGFVEFTDLLIVLANWAPGGCDGGTCEAGDTDCNGAVEFTDLLNVLANWNPQP